LVISFGCASQTGEGFEELVNTINSEEIKRKVKKVVITDTSYLYRHDISEFAKYADPTIPTIWYLVNKKWIEKLMVPIELKSWANEVKTDAFKKWFDKILVDYKDQANFRDAVNIEAAYFSKECGIGNFKNCRDFLLEETAHALAFLDRRVVVYPMDIADSINHAMNFYEKKYTHIKYKLSYATQKKKRYDSHYYDEIDKRVSDFMSGNIRGLNFYVVNRDGEYVYQNRYFGKIVGKNNNKDIDPKSWEVSKRVMDSETSEVLEEEFQNIYYTSFKSPLIINNKVEGVIGLAIDITDRKKREELENKLKMREGLYKVAKEVSHDIASPVTALKIIEEVIKGN
jgi:ribosomal protein L15E